MPGAQNRPRTMSPTHKMSAMVSSPEGSRGSPRPKPNNEQRRSNSTGVSSKPPKPRPAPMKLVFSPNLQTRSSQQDAAACCSYGRCLHDPRSPVPPWRDSTPPASTVPSCKHTALHVRPVTPRAPACMVLGDLPIGRRSRWSRCNPDPNPPVQVVTIPQTAYTKNTTSHHKLLDPEIEVRQAQAG